ncbi:MAG: histidine phosphatase family protein [Deltaproteobacteria bacterium]|nr:histidine phosphatase family protein [Deltaproteobacteria bacterium]
MTIEDIGGQTLDTILRLHQQGIKKIAAIMRHSERHYDNDNPIREPFMSLTEPGKDFSIKFGGKLPSGVMVRAFSSFLGRCIETAYLIDKGYTAKGGKTESNTVELFLSPFYAKDPVEIVKTFVETGSLSFIRSWLDGDFSSELIDNPVDSAQKIVGFAKEKLTESLEDHIDIFVSHDWNLYLVKEVFLGLKHEDYGNVEYLEGVVLYAQNGNIYITNHQAEPRILEL